MPQMSPHMTKLSRSNLSRITSKRDKYARVRLKMGFTALHTGDHFKVLQKCYSHFDSIVSYNIQDIAIELCVFFILKFDERFDLKIEV